MQILVRRSRTWKGFKIPKLAWKKNVPPKKPAQPFCGVLGSSDFLPIFAKDWAATFRKPAVPRDKVLPL